MSITKIRSGNVNYNLLSSNLKLFIDKKLFDDFIAFDNNKYTIIKNNNIFYVFYLNFLKKIKEIKTTIVFHNKIFWKDIDSFDQNNKIIANQIRNQVIYYANNSNYKNNLIGIGGEFYLYFCNLTFQKYYGYSNHQSIIDDANFNCKFYINNFENKIVNYNKFKLNNIYKPVIILNLITVLDNIIEEINKIDFDRLIIISCKPLKSKLSTYFKIVDIKHYENYNGLISVSLFIKKK